MNKVILHGKKCLITIDKAIDNPYLFTEINVELSDDGRQIWICQDGQSIIRIRKHDMEKPKK